MNNLKIYMGLILFSALIYQGKVYAQESAFLVTDRFAYVAGDLVLLSAFVPTEFSESGTRQTAYVGLVSTEKVLITFEILKLKNGRTSGYFSLPDSLRSGTYELQLFSLGDANKSKLALSKRLIYITNRFGKNETITESMDIPVYNLTDIPDYKNSALYSLKLDSEKKAKREKVILRLSADSLQLNDTLWASITVRPITKTDQDFTIKNHKINTTITALNSITPKIESKGIIYSGRLQNKITKQPVKEAVIILAFQDTLLRLKYTFTNESGEFCFSFTDCYGWRTAYLSVFEYPYLQPVSYAEIIINNVFKEEGKNVKPDGHTIYYRSSPDSINIYKSIISKAYHLEYVTSTPMARYATISYSSLYLSGNLTQVVYPEQFMDFNNFEELSREILPFVRYKVDDTGYKISLIDGKNNKIQPDPIVFVDGVPLTDFKLLYNLGSNKIKKIEVRSQPRFYGDLFFENGLLFIWTKNHKFWAVNSDKNIQEVSLQFYQTPIDLHFPNYEKTSKLNIPDFRQVLLWEPEIELCGNNPVTFDFYTSDEPGDFEIIIEGVTQRKNPVFLRKTFTVE